MLNTQQIQNLFTKISSSYDILNHILSFGIDYYWWKKMASMSDANNGCLFLDAASGTGYSSIALTKLGAEVIAIDLTNAMLQLGIKNFTSCPQKHLIKASIEADATNLPFKNNTFDGVTISYGIRNIEYRHQAYREFLRVLKPNKYLTILEFSRPDNLLIKRIYHLYMKHIIPIIIKLVSDTPEMYQHLYQSILKFPDRNTVIKELKDNGFENISFMKLTYGIVTLYKAQKI